VVGIINAFQAMARSGSGGLGTVSAGIAEALVTTAFGLLVAIPAVMAYNAMLGWVDARMVDVSESSNELLDAVVRRLDRGAAAAAGRTAGAGPGASPWA
jgi:biopolymer transport protein ExbB/biopolymer transport protein TolQ